jgi:hypothetical protein
MVIIESLKILYDKFIKIKILIYDENHVLRKKRIFFINSK